MYALRVNLLYNITLSIAVPHPFVIAGGFFVEYYYWDSYWIMQGLLVRA